MKTTSLIFALLMSAVTLFANNNETAEKGYLQGQVFVNSEGRIAPYAIVALEGTNHTTTANANGTFKFTNIPEGSYKLTVAVDGSEPVSLGIVEIKNENPYNLTCLVLY